MAPVSWPPQPPTPHASSARFLARLARARCWGAARCSRCWQWPRGFPSPCAAPWSASSSRPCRGLSRPRATTLFLGRGWWGHPLACLCGFCIDTLHIYIYIFIFGDMCIQVLKKAQPLAPSVALSSPGFGNETGDSLKE